MSKTLRILSLALSVSALAWTTTATVGAQPGGDIRKDVCVLELPGMERVHADTGWTFREIGDRKLKFDLYRPPPPAPAKPVRTKRGKRARVAAPVVWNRRLPVVVFVNSVGAVGVPLREWGIYRSWARLVAMNGMAAVTHDSRPETAREDLDALIEFLRSNASKLGIDRDNIAIWACSANLRLGSAYALDPTNSWIQCAVFYYGAIDTTHLRPDLPVLVARSGLDMPFTNANLTSFVDKTLARNGSVTLLNLPNAHHAFDLVDKDERSREAVRTTLAFLRSNLSSEAQAARRLREEETRAVRLEASRDWEGVLAASRQWMSRDSNDGHPHQLAGNATYQLKRYAEAAGHYEQAGALGWVPALMSYNAACSWALAGNKDKALGDLEKALATGFLRDRNAVLQDPDLASLKDDPRFQKLLASP
jgi:acetyl esterase/lipase